MRARHDRAGAQQAVVDERRLAARTTRDLRRRLRVVAGVHGPQVVVEVEHRHRGEQVHVRVVVGVDGADVSPVAALAVVLARHHVLGEVVDMRHTGRSQRRDDVATEIGVEVVLAGGADDVDERLGVEHVVAHAGQAARLVARHRRRVRRLLVERLDLAVGVGLDDTEALGLLEADRDRRNGDAGLGVQVLVDELADVHPVDVVGAEHAHDIGILVADQVQVLVDRIRRPGEPVRASTHLRGHRRHVVAEQGAEPPRLADVAVEAVAHVLGEHDDLQVARVGEVGQREVDDPVATAERHGRLGTIHGERQHALALSAGKDDDEHLWLGHVCECTS